MPLDALRSALQNADARARVPMTAEQRADTRRKVEAVWAASRSLYGAEERAEFQRWADALLAYLDAADRAAERPESR